MQRAFLAAGLLAVMGASLSCASSTPTSTPERDPRDPLAALVGEWRVTHLRGRAITEMLPTGSRGPTLSVAQDGRVSGFAGVNRMSSSLDVAALDRGEFRMAPAIITKMAGPPEAMAVENAFTAALGETRRYRLERTKLDLTNGQDVLVSLEEAN